MTALQTDYVSKLQRFYVAHSTGEMLIMPNAWDAGSALILSSIGFDALATTSAGLALALGLRDSAANLSRTVVIANAAAIVETTDLPVSADLEDGFGAAPEAVACTIKQAIEAGLCGGAVEDATGDPQQPIQDFALSVARIEAAVAAKSTHPNFMITARSENYLYGRPDLKDTIKRLQAFEAAGADVVYAPGLPDIATVKAVCESVDVPVNVVVGLNATEMTVEQLAKAGVRRISTGGSLARAAMAEVIRAAEELRYQGTTHYADKAIPDSALASYMRNKPR